ncbi:MAG TPA: hypothetical protein VHX64_06925 [Caulobacteraceae bacterium]|nr:hypothetical protein [Caulobacteraceae bacterium]
MTLRLAIVVALSLAASTSAFAQRWIDKPDGWVNRPAQPPDAPISPAEHSCRWGKTVQAQIRGCTGLIARSRDPHVQAQALDLRGLAESAAHRWELAVADFNAANRLWPEFLGPYVDRAQLRLNRGDSTGALSDYDQMIHAGANAPGFDLAVGYDGRCWVRALANVDLDDAMADCNTAQRLDPRDSVTYSDRALVWLRKGEASRAIEDADFALGLDSSNVEALYFRALAQRTLDHFSDAGADMAAAARQDSTGEIAFLRRWGIGSSVSPASTP